MRIKGSQGEKNTLSQPPRGKDHPSFIPSHSRRFKLDHADCLQVPRGLSTREGPDYPTVQNGVLLFNPCTDQCFASSSSAFHRHSLWQHQQDSWQLSTLHALKRHSGPAESQIPTDLHRCTQALQDVEMISDYSCSFEQRWVILVNVLFGNYKKVSYGFILALQFTYTLNSKPSDTTRHINQQFHSYVS